MFFRIGQRGARCASMGTRRKHRHRFLPRFELLEDRATPSVATFTSVADNTMYQSNTQFSNGAGPSFFVGETAQSSLRRGLLKFDLLSGSTPVPAGSTINSVTLTLSVIKTPSGGGSPDTVSLHDALTAWGEGTSNAGATGGGKGVQATAGDATWQFAVFNTQNWTTAGGDFGPAITSTTVNGAGSYTWSGSNLASDVQKWVNNTSANLGWVLTGSESTPDSAREFSSRESSTNQPTLTVNFTSPAASADLTVSKSHTGNFTEGDPSDTYTISVSNVGGTATSGTVTVTDTLPAGLSPTSDDNTTNAGWSITFSGQTITATRNDSLAASNSYPNLLLKVSVANNASASITNTATVSGGGETNTANDSSSDPTTVNLEPDMTVVKSHTGDFTQGDAADTYKIVVTNSGGAASNGTVTVTDTLPTGLSPTADDNTTSGGWTISFVNQTITAARSDSLTAGSGYPDLLLTVVVADDAPASVTNTVTVAGGGEVNTSDDGASDPTTITQVADLTIAKSHTGNFTQGDSGDTYKIVVSNNGPGPTVGTVTVTDTLPTGLSPTSADNRTVSGWTISFLNQTITATRSDALSSGGSYADLPITVAVAADAPTSITNSAAVSGGGEINTANDSASDPTTVIQVADLTISKSHTGDFTDGDASDTYTISVGNAGPGPTNGTVTVTDTLPNGLSPTSDDNRTFNGWNITFSNQTITATRSDVLASGNTYSDLILTVAVANDAATSVTNTATVAGGGELNTANDSASDPTNINLVPDLTIAKKHTAVFTQGDPGDTYTITVTNSGGADTSGTVTVTDTLPVGLMPTSDDNTTSAGWTISFVNQTITATRSDVLGSGASYADLILTVAVAADAPGSATNTATVAGGGEINTADDTATDPTTINAAADLTVALGHTDTFTHGDAGDHYTITVSNSGGPTRGTVTVTDTLPAGLLATGADSGTINGWNVSSNGQAITATRSDGLSGAGSFLPLTLTVAVADDAPASVTNTVTVSGGGELNTANDTANDSTTIFNAAPSNIVPASASTPADTPLPLTGISIADIDAGSDTILVVLNATNGTLAVNAGVAGGVTAANVVGNGTNLVTLLSTVAGIDATLADANGLVFTPASGFAGPALFTLVTNDLGNSGSGGPLSATSTEAITVTQVLDHLAVELPANAVAGVPFNVTVKAFDHADALINNFAGTVIITGTDPHESLPPTLPLSGGTGTFAATFETAGNQTILATDVLAASFMAQGSVQVAAAAARQLVFQQQPANTLVSAPFLPPVTITALDGFGNLATGDNSDVVSVGLHNNPAGATLTGGAGVKLSHGLAVFPGLQLNKAGAGFILAASSPMLPIVFSSSFDVAAVAKLTITTTQTTVQAGTQVSVTVKAVDAKGNPVQDYGGLIHFSSNDRQADLPPDSPLSQGQGTFQITLKTAGPCSISIKDVAKPALTATLAKPVTVTPAPVNSLTVSTVLTTNVSQAQMVTVSAIDLYGNVNPTYRGSVTLTSSDPAAKLPAAHAFTAIDAGKHPFPVTFSTAGLRTVAAGDNTFSGSQANIVVAAKTVSIVQQQDPQDGSKTALVIVGTAGKDAIDISPASADGTQVQVTVNGVSQGTFSPTGHVFVFGVAGNDTIRLLTGTGAFAGVPVAVPTVIEAGSGSSTVNASGGSKNNILVGGAGTGALTGGTGNDILIAGSGPAVLHGGIGNDVLVAGTTTLANNLAALLALMTEWSNASTDFLTGIQHLSGLVPGGANTPYFLNSSTDHAGAALDQLFGDGGSDWFLATAAGQARDLVSGDVLTGF